MAKQRRKSHRGAILFLLLLAAGLFALWRGNTSVQTEEFPFASERLPAGFDGFRAAVLTDLHGARFGKANEKLVAAVEEQSPDAIFLVGDLVDERTENAAEYVSALASQLAITAPTYYVTGNHEWARGTEETEELKTALRDAGVCVLSNEFVSVERGGDAIVIAGIDDPNGYAEQKTPEELRDEVQNAKGECFSILLAHRDSVEYYDELGFSLTVCGHGHGGIFRIPLLDRGLLGTDRRFFPAYDGGLYELNGGNVCFVSRGLGNIGASFRVFNRPQLAVITLERG